MDIILMRQNFNKYVQTKENIYTKTLAYPHLDLCSQAWIVADRDIKYFRNGKVRCLPLM